MPPDALHHTKAPEETKPSSRPTPPQLAWLARGASQPGGKLPLFDDGGQRISPRTIRACIHQGWAQPWFANPLKPDWLVCKLTPEGRAVAARERRSARLAPPPAALAKSLQD